MAGAETVFFVATDGDDQWSGRQPAPVADGTDGPFATLTRARNAVRALKHAGGLQQPVTVQVRGGTYHLSEPLRLSGGDSGTETCQITYMAYPGERPILSGGRCVTDWQPHEGEIVCTHLSEVRTKRWWFRQLFFNGKRMIRARRPKYDHANPVHGGWAFVKNPVPEGNLLDNVEKIDLDLEWRFKPDPEETGVEEEWFAPDTADNNWLLLRTNQLWDMQGFKNYHGVGWYRTRFRMPADFDTREHLWLLFGAASKEAYVYIDGRKVFERTAASTGIIADALWDMPFKFDVRPLLEPGREHSITVRLESRAHTGGIWRRVSLVSADTDVPSDLLSGVVPDAVAFQYEPGLFPHRWAKPDQAEVFMIPGKSWINDIIPISHVNVERNRIHLTRTVQPSAGSLSKCMGVETGNRFYVENALEDLDQPGEWCLDSDTGMLYFWPPAGSDMRSGEVTAPTTARLIQMIGTPGTAVSHIRIAGFTLTQTQAQFPTPETHYKIPNSGQALYMENTADCTVENNCFEEVGGDAIRLQNTNARNRIVGNEITGAGGYGIFLGSVQRGFCRGDTTSGDVPGPGPWHDFREDREVVVNAWPKSPGHLIHNNHIHHVGVFEKHACGVAFFGISAVDVVVSHNLIHHTPRFGIGLMSGFGPITIECNELHHLSMETCDTGGICMNRWYTYDKDPDLARGNIIRFNKIHDVIGCGAGSIRMEPGDGKEADGQIWSPYYGWAIYFDNGPMDVLVYGNICARNVLGGIMLSHYARNITVENNIFVDGDNSQIYLSLAGDTGNIRFRRNIFCYANTDADFLRLNIDPGREPPDAIVEFDKNVFSPAPGGEITFCGLPGEAVLRTGMATQADAGHTLESWRAMGFDQQSLVADPMFVDAANDNYDLAADSPALKLGFKPIDTAKIGLVPDDE